MTEAGRPMADLHAGAAHGTADVAVIILTFNEELNLRQAIESVQGWARQVLVFDSYSTDRTLALADELGCTVVQHRFRNYADQRNQSLDKLPITAEWVLFLDADEWVPAALKDEISRVLAGKPAENGFYLKRRFIWMGRWIKRGYYPSSILRLFRLGRGRCEEREVNEHLIVDEPIGRLENDFIHEDRNDVSRWVAKHTRYAQKEAEEILRRDTREQQQLDATPFGTQAQRARWLRQRVWNRLPPLARPFGYFAYRYFLRGGFLDGKEAFVYHFLQALWYPFLIDVNYLEMRHERSGQGTP
jgi:glycosyltransferase involved in cell wall biosynthesis